MILPPLFGWGSVFRSHPDTKPVNIRTPNPSTSGQVTIAIAGHYAVALTSQVRFLEGLV